jgi:hypothetical protein
MTKEIFREKNIFRFLEITNKSKNIVRLKFILVSVNFSGVVRRKNIYFRIIFKKEKIIL